VWIHDYERVQAMSQYETFTCETCGWFGDVTDPITGLEMGARYNGQMLCSSCRVDQRLADGDFA